jgi:hypothetical protein
MTIGDQAVDVRAREDVAVLIAAAADAGIELAPDAAAAVLRLTGGWPDAVDRTLRRLVGSAEPAAEVQALALRPVRTCSRSGRTPAGWPTGLGRPRRTPGRRSRSGSRWPTRAPPGTPLVAGRAVRRGR